MYLRNLRERRRHGTAAVELAVMLPFLLVVILGIWEVGRMVHVQQIIANAAREGGRQASSGQASASTVTKFVVDYCNINGLTNVNSSMVTMTNITNSSRSDPMTADQLDQFRITITVPYSAIRWSTVAQITPNSNVSASVDWYSMRDLPVSYFTSIPTN